jgi:transcriptional regulator with XRE-family HTH domain
MSKRLKVSQSIVSRIETGKHRLTPDYVRRICAALGIRAAALTRAPQVN